MRNHVQSFQIYVHIYTHTYTHLQRLGFILIRILEFNANGNIPRLRRGDKPLETDGCEKQVQVPRYPRTNFSRTLFLTDVL